MKITKGDFTEDDIHKAKEMLKGRLLLSLEDSHDTASLVGSRYLLEERIVYPDQIIAKLEAVKKEDVVNVAKQLFIPSNLNVAVIGPFSKDDIKLTF